ncbi:MAG: dCMP deaminase family protein [Clostridia bacterium]|nr:dCMP deaminase family protein [Clostridia bacterium]
MKRQEYLSWDEYFMGIALLSAKRSKDPSTQVGACIVNKDKRILSMGYNGMPRCCSDDEFPWDKNDNPLDSKYLYVCHAELNAILNCDRGNVRDCIVYTTLFPCNECAKAIIQSGIAEVVYMEDKYSDSDSVIASKKMFDTAGVKYRLYDKSNKTLELAL